MQTKNQGKRPKDWKVVAALATASAFGLSGLALAGSDEGSGDPDPINLRDRTSISEVTTPSSVPTTIAALLDLSADSPRSLDSPFDDSPDSPLSPDSPDSPLSPDSPDSPDSPLSPDSPDSPDDNSADS